ncbi:TIR domain-containing protein [Amycolatopsis sp. NPDC051758]|uniref:TIR domain-containing protein n=1 Tax=Amycolatopsis sp. NPDC051758 TaxID=3363935 RepID=UPI0037A36D37
MLFINFRGDDGADKAAWLDAELSAVFGKNKVFRSSRSIDLGHDYEPIMWDAVDNCSAMIAVIGDGWLSDSRLFEPGDVVRQEIARALAAGKPVIPVLEQTGRLRRDALPPDLAELADCQYVRLTYRDAHAFPGLVDRLIDAAPDLGIGVRDGIKDLATWSRERTALTGSRLPAELDLLGRDEQVAQVRSWLSGPPGNLIIRGQTSDEVAAFTAAVLDGHDPHHRAVRVTSAAGWQHATRIPPSFPAVVVSDDVPVSEAQNSRHVVIARDGFEQRPGGLSLPRIPRDKARDAFLAMGVPLHQADELGGLARRSTQALIRRLSPNAPRPPWVQPPDSAIAAPLSLVSRWSTTNKADHEVIARITGEAYSRVERFATVSAASRDPFLHRSGSRWQLADPLDAWSQLAAQISDTDIRQFSAAAIDVLSESDPVLSLPDPEVPTAKLTGAIRKWSDDLRQGIAHGLARLGDSGSARIAGSTAGDIAATVVHQLLRQANADRTGLAWRSLRDVLPLLAEAAPRVFLDAVSAGLRGTDPLLRVMFEDAEGRTLNRHSAHTRLLWALETVTWAPQHGTEAALLLAQLARIDPGGQPGNRPDRSLLTVIAPAPESPLPLERRTAVIGQVRTKYPEVGWRLLSDLTDRAPFLTPLARPRVRQDWLGSAVTPSDSLKIYRDAVFDAVLTDLGTVPDRWATWLTRLTGLSASHQESLLTALETTDFSQADPEAVRALWDQCLKLVNFERNGSSGPRFFSVETIDRLSSFLTTIEPTDDPTRHAWLFTWHPDIPDVELTDLEAHDAAVERLRTEVVAEELARHGVDGLAQLADASDRGQTVGWALAQVAGDTVRDEMIARLTEPLAEGWIWCRAKTAGQSWATDLFGALPDDPARRTAFLLALPSDWAVGLLAQEEPDVRDRFWSSAPAFPYPAEQPEAYLAEILGQGRAVAVIDALSLALYGNDQSWHPAAELVEAAFDRLLNTSAQVTSYTAYAVGRLLDYLHVTGHDLHAVARWEIAFAGLFHDRTPRALLELIAADPAAFVELHQFRYLPTEKINPKAIRFWWTGEHLRCLPGQTGDVMDRSRLLEWVRQARELLNAIGMLHTGDQAIGTLLATGPAGADGAWPTEAVRDVLELDDSGDLREGFVRGIGNNIGFTTRGVYDGGDQERASAEAYLAWADKIEAGWPLAAGALRDHAESLRWQAKRWDAEAEDDHDE